MARRERRAALALLLTLACAPRGPTTAEPGAPKDMSLETSGAAAVAACDKQASAVQDGLVRLADRYLWEEIELLVQAHAATRGRPDATRCAEATRAALTTVTLRWAEQGAESGGSQSHALARQAYAALRKHFPAEGRARRCCTTRWASSSGPAPSG